MKKLRDDRTQDSFRGGSLPHLFLAELLKMDNFGCFAHKTFVRHGYLRQTKTRDPRVHFFNLQRHAEGARFAGKDVQFPEDRGVEAGRIRHHGGPAMGHHRVGSGPRANH